MEREHTLVQITACVLLVLRRIEWVQNTFDVEEFRGIVSSVRSVRLSARINVSAAEVWSWRLCQKNCEEREQRSAALLHTE